MAVQIGQKQESDFSNPLGLLSDCHRRIEHFLDVLVRVCGRARGRSLEPEEKIALQKALAYFRNSAPKHTADEEESLFPRLRGSPEASSSLDRLRELEQEHQLAARDHQIVECFGTRWVDGERPTSDQALELEKALERLSELYRHHIAVEDGELFPLAAKLLRSEELSAVGREMADRRNVNR